MHPELFWEKAFTELDKTLNPKQFTEKDIEK